ncbi:hypothetical protein PAMP_024170 [Pampus punctatissimus]
MQHMSSQDMSPQSPACLMPTSVATGDIQPYKLPVNLQREEKLNVLTHAPKMTDDPKMLDSAFYCESILVPPADLGENKLNLCCPNPSSRDLETERKQERQDEADVIIHDDVHS